ncbi:hypothetical protein [Limobrevibacterium gyesilva]|uniref:Uncharacterized protein n=1 Tax=Limobrevibacterium gyesilva TaxID=2991712 RepID=A0AA42CER3_9PROT|nr:hypothetical protein [Limobrevibacterium gyesilva]MCW3473866.1 hypothetical protein [Limobrevibacterium gyesilva]
MDVTGHLDLCGPELVEGWIFWHREPARKLELQVFMDNQLVGACMADLFRQDLRDAGLGDGHCAFSFRIPEGTTIRDFGSTRLRLTGSVLYLLPDNHTTFAPAIQPSAIAQVAPQTTWGRVR